VLRVNPDNRTGLQTKNGLKDMVERLRLNVTNITLIFSELHQDQDTLRKNFTMKSQTTIIGDKTKSSNGNEWLSKQANQIFDKITDFYSAKRVLRNRDAADTISEVKDILDEFVGVIQSIIPREVDKYYDTERRAEMQEERRRVERDTPRDPRRERSRSPINTKIVSNRSTRGHGSPERRRGGKSMKPKQHRNSKTQKKRQCKNQKK
jgi:hypothetical protein